MTDSLSKIIPQSLNSFYRRCEAAKAAGGVPLFRAVEGDPVPDGWVLDIETYYYLPPNVRLL